MLLPRFLNTFLSWQTSLSSALSIHLSLIYLFYLFTHYIYMPPLPLFLLCFESLCCLCFRSSSIQSRFLILFLPHRCFTLLSYVDFVIQPFFIPSFIYSPFKAYCSSQVAHIPLYFGGEGWNCHRI